MKSVRRKGNGRALRNLRPTLKGSRKPWDESPERVAQREEWLRRIAAQIEADERAAHQEDWLSTR